MLRRDGAIVELTAGSYQEGTDKNYAMAAVT
jgi:hypothetical protein